MGKRHFSALAASALVAAACISPVSAGDLSVNDPAGILDSLDAERAPAIPQAELEATKGEGIVGFVAGGICNFVAKSIGSDTRCTLFSSLKACSPAPGEEGGC